MNVKIRNLGHRWQVRLLGGVLLAVLLFLPGLAVAGGTWVVTDKGFRVLNNHPQSFDAAIWSGGADSGGYAAGQGVLQWVQGGVVIDRYEGNLSGGVPAGKGKYIWGNGSRYEGNFVDGRWEGRGVFTWANGDRYEGSISAANATAAVC